MTDDEKKRMLSIVRAVEHLFSENIALKTVLAMHRISKTTWEREVAKLMNDPELGGQVRPKFSHLYAEIEQSPDLSKVLELLALKLPKSDRQN